MRLWFLLVLTLFVVCEASDRELPGKNSTGTSQGSLPPSQPAPSSKNPFPFSLFDPVAVHPEEIALLSETERNRVILFECVHPLRGVWKSGNDKPIELFSNTVGKVRTTFKYKGAPLQRDIELSLYDGRFQQTGALRLEIHNFTFNTSLVQQTYSEAVEVIYLRNLREQFQRICNVSVSFDFSRTLKPSNTINDLSDTVGVRISSSNCSLPDRISIKPENEEFYQVLIFCSVLFFSVILSYVLFFRVGLKVFNYADAVKLSPISFLIFTAWDAFTALTLFQLSLYYDAYFWYFIPLIGFYLLKWIFLDARVTIVLWKSTDHYRDKGLLSHIMDIVMLGALGIVFTALIYTFWLNNYILPFLTMVLIPQIYHNVKREARPENFQIVLVVLSIVNIFPMLYLSLNEYNFLDIGSSTVFSILAPFLQTFQALVIYLQIRLGATFFIPSATRALKLQYTENVTTKEKSPIEEFELSNTKDQ